MKRLLTLFCLLSAPALAQTAPTPPSVPPLVIPYQVDMQATLTDLHGEVIKDPTEATPADPTCSKCKALTVGSAIATALCAESRANMNDTGLVKFKRCTLGTKLQDAGKVTLSVDEAKMIEDNFTAWGPIIAARVFPLIDPGLDAKK